MEQISTGYIMRAKTRRGEHEFNNFTEMEEISTGYIIRANTRRGEHELNNFPEMDQISTGYMTRVNTRRGEHELNNFTEMEQISTGYTIRANKRRGEHELNNDLTTKRCKSSLIHTCLRLYQKASTSQSPDEKSKLVKELLELLSGRINTVIFRHDVARVLQLMIKYGLPEDKEKIVDEMLPNLKTIACREYSHHLIKSFMIHCSSEIRGCIIKELQNHTPQILRSNIGVKVLELVYTDYCNSLEKQHFKCRVLEANVNVDDSTSQEELDGTPAPSTRLINLLQRDFCVKSSIVTSVLHDYLNTCPHHVKLEIKNLLLPSINDLISTKSGSYCALQILWICTTKERKMIIKQLPLNWVELCFTESGSFFILALFDCIDDTELLNKIILRKLTYNIRKVLENEWSHRIFDFMFLHHLATNRFSLTDRMMLRRSTNESNTKKNADQRLNEIKNFCYRSILKDIINHTEKWLSSSQCMALLVPILKFGIDSEIDFNSDLESTFDAISKFVVSSERSIDDVKLHLLVKKFISLDTSRLTKRQSLFSTALLKHIHGDVLKKWFQTNRGCFFFVGIVELEIEAVSKMVSEFCQDSTIKSLLLSGMTIGGELLLDKIMSQAHSYNQEEETN